MNNKTTKGLILLFLFIIFFSCKRENETKTFYSNGKIKEVIREADLNNKIVEEYDTLGYLKLKGFYNHKTRDSLFGYNPNGTLNFKRYFKGVGTKSIEYDVNGILQKEGIYIHDTIKVGWWKFYRNEKISAMKEYVIVCEDYYLNQNVEFKNKDTLFDKSTFFYISKKAKTDKNIVEINYSLKSLFEKNKLQLIILKNEYCSEEPDTVISLDSNKGKIYLDEKYTNKKGFFFDYTTAKNNNDQKAPYTMKHHKMYFDFSKY